MMNKEVLEISVPAWPMPIFAKLEESEFAKKTTWMEDRGIAGKIEMKKLEVTDNERLIKFFESINEKERSKRIKNVINKLKGWGDKKVEIVIDNLRPWNTNVVGEVERKLAKLF